MSILGKLFSGKPKAQESAAEFHPSNELERVLVQAQSGTLSVDDFFERLLASQVALLLDKEVPESGWDNSSSPLVLKSPRGGNVLAAFTEVDRATLMSQRSSSHKYALLVDFQWVLKGVAPGLGIVLNPGWPVGVEIEPTRVAELKNA